MRRDPASSAGFDVAEFFDIVALVFMAVLHIG
jgi:hypothetical protein